MMDHPRDARPRPAEMAADPDDIARHRWRSRRTQAQIAVQREVALRLIVAGVFFAVVTVAAAWILAGQAGHRSARSVTPVLMRFLQSGAEGNVIAARLLLSDAGLRHISEAQLAADIADKSLWAKPVGMRVDQFTFVDGRGGNDGADIAATVLYEARPPARLEATMSYELDAWRVTKFTLRRGGAAP